MELLFLCLLPLIAEIAFTALLLVLGHGIAILMAVARVVFVRRRGDPVPVPTGPDTAAAAARPYSWRRRVRNELIVFAVLLLGLASLPFLLFESLFERGLGNLDREAGIELSYEGFAGSLASGRIELTGVELRKPERGNLRCDLRASKVVIELDLFSLLGEEARVRQLTVESLHGDVTWVSAFPGFKKKRRVLIDDLRITDLDLQLTDQVLRDRAYRLTADEWRCRGLDTRTLPFDTLFRSEIAGQLDTGRFSLSTKGPPAQSQTHWRVTDMPVWYVAGKLGEKFKSLKEGRFDATADWTWSDHGAADVTSQWILAGHDLRSDSRLANLVLKRLNGKQFEFGLPVSRAAFEAARSGGSVLGALSKSLWARITRR